MILVGLTGGLATGKSTVAKMFKRCGAVVIDADQLARDAVKPGTPAWKEIVITSYSIHYTKLYEIGKSHIHFHRRLESSSGILPERIRRDI